MKMLVIAALMLPLTGAAAQGPEQAQSERTAPAQLPPSELTARNLLDNGASNCRSYTQQISDVNKRLGNEARRLNQEPPAHMFLAVDRHVGGCREVTLVRRDVAPTIEPDASR
jgi:hypothetical protein